MGLTEAFEDEPNQWIAATVVAFEGGSPDAEGNVSLPDLAVLKLDRRSDRRAVPVAARRLEPGETIVTMGFPGTGGGTITLTRGVYSGTDGGYIKTDTDISPGNSGGAAFDEQGVLVGVPTGGSHPDRGSTELGLLIPAEDAARFLQHHVGD